MSSINPKFLTLIPSNSSSLRLEATCLPICSSVFSSLSTGRTLTRFPNEFSKHIIHSIPKKNHLWYQSEYLHLNCFPAHWNLCNTSTYCNPFPCFHNFRNLPQSRKLLKRSLKSMPTPTKISTTWTSLTSPKTPHQPLHPPPFPKKPPHQSHPPYLPLYQKSIPSHHTVPNTSKRKI